MINIISSPYAHEVVAKGHANFAEYGKDIVCASVTTLMCALGDILNTENIDCTISIDDMGGQMRIKAKPKIDQVHDCKIMFKTITNALRDIASAYPDNVDFKEI